jgi:hypothetical protein
MNCSDTGARAVTPAGEIENIHRLCGWRGETIPYLESHKRVETEELIKDLEVFRQPHTFNKLISLIIHYL